jgi:hypothetical protein
MTTIQITLPDELAKNAASAGLLAPERFEAWLREQLKAKHIDSLFAAMKRMDADDGMTPLTPEQIATEIAAMRAEARNGAH